MTLTLTNRRTSLSLGRSGPAGPQGEVGPQGPPGTDLDWINVTESPYNATGDGTTDDSDAILDAIDACPEGGTVYFPRPAVYYKVSIQPHTGSPFVLKRGVTVIGPGRDVPCLYVDPESYEAYDWSLDGNSHAARLFHVASGCTIRDLNVQGNADLVDRTVVKRVSTDLFRSLAGSGMTFDLSSDATTNALTALNAPGGSATSHGYAVGDRVSIYDHSGTYVNRRGNTVAIEGEFIVASVPTPSTFTLRYVDDIVAGASDGQVAGGTSDVTFERVRADGAYAQARRFDVVSNTDDTIETRTGGVAVSHGMTLGGIVYIYNHAGTFLDDEGNSQQIRGKYYVAEVTSATKIKLTEDEFDPAVDTPPTPLNINAGSSSGTITASGDGSLEAFAFLAASGWAFRYIECISEGCDGSGFASSGNDNVDYGRHTYERCESRGHTWNGMVAFHTRGIVAHDCVSEENEDNGWQMEWAHDCQWFGGRLERNGENGVGLIGPSTGNLIDGVRLSGNGWETYLGAEIGIKYGQDEYTDGNGNTITANGVAHNLTFRNITWGTIERRRIIYKLDDRADPLPGTPTNIRFIEAGDPIDYTSSSKIRRVTHTFDGDGDVTSTTVTSQPIALGSLPGATFADYDDGLAVPLGRIPWWSGSGTVVRYAGADVNMVGARPVTITLGASQGRSFPIGAGGCDVAFRVSGIPTTSGETLVLQLRPVGGANLGYHRITAMPSDVGVYRTEEVRAFLPAGAEYEARLLNPGSSSMTYHLDEVSVIRTGSIGLGTLRSVLRQLPWYEDDFLSGATTTAAIGALGWGSFSSAGSANISANNAGAATTMGVLRVQTPAQAAYTGIRLVSGVGNIVSADAPMRFVASASPLNVSTSRRRIGWGNDPTADAPDNWLGFEHGSGENWHAVTRSGAGTAVRTDTGVAPAATTTVLLEQWREDASTICFRVNNGTIIRHTTGIPTGTNLNLFVAVATPDTTARSIDLDYIGFGVEGLAR